MFLSYLVALTLQIAFIETTHKNSALLLLTDLYKFYSVNLGLKE